MANRIKQSFYNSKAWKDMRKYIWIKQSCLCARCNSAVYVDGISEWMPKEKRLTGIVHHKEYLNNMNLHDDNIALDENNLEGICIKCHNEEHFEGTGVTKKDVMFDDKGNLIPKPITKINNYENNPV